MRIILLHTKLNIVEELLPNSKIVMLSRLKLYDPNGDSMLDFTFKFVPIISSHDWDAKVEESIKDVNQRACRNRRKWILLNLVLFSRVEVQENYFCVWKWIFIRNYFKKILMLLWLKLFNPNGYLLSGFSFKFVLITSSSVICKSGRNP